MIHLGPFAIHVESVVLGIGLAGAVVAACTASSEPTVGTAESDQARVIFEQGFRHGAAEEAGSAGEHDGFALK